MNKSVFLILSFLSLSSAFASDESDADPKLSSCEEAIRKEKGPMRAYIKKHFIDKGWSNVFLFILDSGEVTSNNSNYGYKAALSSEPINLAIRSNKSTENELYVGEWLGFRFQYYDSQSRTNDRGFLQVALKLQGGKTVYVKHSNIAVAYMEKNIIFEGNDAATAAINKNPRDRISLGYNVDVYGRSTIELQDREYAEETWGTDRFVGTHLGSRKNSYNFLRGKKLELMVSTEVPGYYILIDGIFSSYSEVSERMSPASISRFTFLTGAENQIEFKIDASQIKMINIIKEEEPSSFTLIE